MKEPDDDIMAGRDLGTIDLMSPSACEYFRTTLLALLIL
jgi:hypothetical protein